MMQCRFCKSELNDVFIDLGNSPASNSFLTKAELNEPETFYPLKVYTCTRCFLVQVDEYKKSAAIFSSDYAYFSSYSKGWLAHCKKYTDNVTERFNLTGNSLVVEIASNDGYLLQYFNEKNIPVLGIEPTSNTAAVAEKKGIPTIVEFFGEALAAKLSAEGKKADLLLGNNVLAHVPDILDFVGGMKMLLAPDGIITMEFPHVMQLIINSQFDTIYHEHFSYLSLFTVTHIFESCGLTVFDAEELETHGGSLRIFARHTENTRYSSTLRLQELAGKESAHGINDPGFYQNFSEKALKIKLELLEFLVRQKKENKTVVAYGAAAKGNTLLNFCGVKSDLIDFVVDASEHKQNKFLPASHIPVVSEAYLRESRPDFVLILPWNLKEEIVHQLAYIKEWGGRFVTPVPALEVSA